MNKYIISNILVYIGGILFILSILNILLKYIINKRKILTNYNSYDICKKLIDNHNIEDVNIIEVTSGNKNIYNLERRTIRLSNKTYNSNDIYSIAISSYLAGLCILNDSKNQYIKALSKYIKKYNYLSLSSIISIIIANLFKGYYSIVGLIILISLFIYEYYKKSISNINKEQLLIEIKEIKKIDNNEKNKIISVINTLDLSYNIALIITILNICSLLFYLVK